MSRYVASLSSLRSPDRRSACLGKAEQGMAPVELVPSPAFPDGEERSEAEWIADPGPSATTCGEAARSTLKTKTSRFRGGFSPGSRIGAPLRSTCPGKGKRVRLRPQPHPQPLSRTKSNEA